jgi:hypothetical protein
MNYSPRAFISHATEDKQRFVVNFATKLRERGVDAWLDQWEIKAGDSLIQKIFEEGIRQADVFIVVLSSVSVGKPWVREELDTGIVNRIKNNCRLIPIVIDECQIPEALSHLCWVKVKDFVNYEQELNSIVNTIFGSDDKPALGAIPKHASNSQNNFFTDLTKIDNLVFASLCRQYLQTTTSRIDIQNLDQELALLDVKDDLLAESLEVLENRGLIRTLKNINGDILHIFIAPSVADSFFRQEMNDYDLIQKNVVSKIVNEGFVTNVSLEQATSLPLPLVNHVLDVFEDRKLLRLSKTTDGIVAVAECSRELKRLLR